ncbi:carbohydrate sulfotransferase 14-like [Saccoglossus kowalevskii]
MMCKNDKTHQRLKTLPANERNVLTRQIIVNDQYRFLYCAVPKVACSNWKRVIRVLNGQWEKVDMGRKMDHRKGFRFLANYSDDEIEYRLKHYYKFMFVRNPITRLLSAYRDKFTRTKVSFIERYGKKIAKKYRPLWEVTGNSSDIKITFGEFVKYLIDTPTSLMDQHWRPMFEICQPCAVNYSFIGSIENLHNDVQTIFKDLSVQDLVQFPNIQTYYNVTTSSIIQEELAKISDEDLRQLISKYALDFATFAYSAPKLSF